MSQELKVFIRQYIEYDDAIKDFNKKIKELKDQKKQMEGHIVKYMTETEITQINLNNSKLKLHTSKKYAPLNKQFIVKTLQEHAIKEDAIERVSESLSNREAEELKILKRTI